MCWNVHFCKRIAIIQLQAQYLNLICTNVLTVACFRFFCLTFFCQLSCCSFLSFPSFLFLLQLHLAHFLLGEFVSKGWNSVRPCPIFTNGRTTLLQSYSCCGTQKLILNRTQKKARFVFWLFYSHAVFVNLCKPSFNHKHDIFCTLQYCAGM